MKKMRTFIALLLAASVLLIPASAQSTSTQGGAEIDEGVDIFAPVLDQGDLGDHTHGSTIVQFPDGELMAAWFQGNGERDGLSTRIMAARKPVGADSFGDPFVLVDTPRMADINPALYVDENETLWLFWYPVLGGRWETSQPKYLQAEKGHYESAQGHDQVPDWTWQDAIYVTMGGTFSGTRESDKVDGGTNSDGTYKDAFTQLLKEKYEEFGRNTFLPVSEGGDGVNEVMRGGDEYADFVSERLELSLGKSFFAKKGVPYARRWGWQTKDKPIEIQWEGRTRLILPLYSDIMECSIMAITEDGGRTWQFSEPIVGFPVIQASLLMKDDGQTLVCYLRDNGEAPQRIATSTSTDGGMTWSMVQDHQGLFDPGVGSDLAELPNGNWVFVHNDNQFGRSSLTVALSEDEGETWTYRRHIGMDTRESAASFHYPAIITNAAGEILITYTVDYPGSDGSLAGKNHIKFLAIDEDWIREGDAIDKVYSYDMIETDLTYDLSNDTSLRELPVPQTVKGYRTYTSTSTLDMQEDGMNPYVDLPLLWDEDAWTRFEQAVDSKGYNEVVDLDMDIDTAHLPDGVTADMLPSGGVRIRLMVCDV